MVVETAFRKIVKKGVCTHNAGCSYFLDPEGNLWETNTLHPEYKKYSVAKKKKRAEKKALKEQARTQRRQEAEKKQLQKKLLKQKKIEERLKKLEEEKKNLFN
jgi:uncharacterized protein YaiI (UPF0178 family)